MNPAPANEVRAALDRAAAVGVYFSAAASDGRPAHVPLGTLLDDPTWLIERADAVRAAFDGCAGERAHQRASASVDHLGLVARLVSPGLAAASLASIVPVLDRRSVLHDSHRSGTFQPVFLPLNGSIVDSAALAADELIDGAVATVLTDVNHAFARTFRLPLTVLWGNVASAFAGAAGQIDRSGLPVRLNPVDIVATLLAGSPLAGLGAFIGAGSEQQFRRRTCCLLYQLPAGQKCGDCVLRVSSELITDDQER